MTDVRLLDRLFALRCKYHVYRATSLADALAYDPLRLHWISPDALTREVPGRALRRRYTPGAVVAGDWDRLTVEFASSCHFRGFEQHFVEGRPWQETVLYRDALGRAPGKYWHGRRNEAEILALLHEYDAIYESIARDGYLTQRELARRRPRRRIGLTPPELGEIIAHIDRDGRYLFDDGRHRLSIAKILRLEKIPVLVVVRHRDWYEAARRRVGGPSTVPAVAARGRDEVL